MILERNVVFLVAAEKSTSVSPEVNSYGLVSYEAVPHPLILIREHHLFRLPEEILFLLRGSVNLKRSSIQLAKRHLQGISTQDPRNRSLSKTSFQVL